MSSESVHVRVMVRVRPYNKRELTIHQQQQNSKQQVTSISSFALQKSDTNNSKDDTTTTTSNTPQQQQLTHGNNNNRNISGRESPSQLSTNNSFARTVTPPNLQALLLSPTTSSAPGGFSGGGAGTTPSYPPSVVCIGENETIHFLEPERDWNEREAFRFDKVFWSVPDEQSIAPPGSSSALFCPPNSPHTQKDVFEEAGRPILESSLKGINTCFFAYGQTGAGKSYSMSGTPDDEGVAPQFVRALFEEIDRKKSEESDSNYEVKIELGFFEIYNEKVRDLLSVARASEAAAAGKTVAAQQQAVSEQSYSNCRVRQFPGKGTFVEGLQRKVIINAEDCLEAITAGMSQRATAATSMNATSSRSHGIFQLMVTQRFSGVTRMSQVNLVDLAGSERVKQSQVTGTALTEAAMINKSLSTLRRVIDVLIDNSNLKKGRTPAMPPYRESLLTYCLQDSLGGNSKTVMIAAVSPHQSCSEDTLSTLRYALKAKAIVCTAKVNEEKTSAILGNLKEEIDLLKQQLSENASTSLAQELAARQQEMEEMSERAKKLEARQKVMADELDRRKAEIEAAQAQLQQLDQQIESEGKDREEVEALVKVRQELLASEQALQLESASRQRAEENLQKATEHRKFAEELHLKTQEEITNAKKEEKEMRVRQLLTTFQSAFVRMMKGQDLDQLRQERAKSLKDLEEANRKLAQCEKQLDGLNEQKSKLDKSLVDIRSRIDKVAHSDMLSDNPMRDRRIGEVKKKREAANEELKKMLLDFDESVAKLNRLKEEEQDAKSRKKVEKARLLTEIAEIDRQARHVTLRINQHEHIIQKHEDSAAMYREKSQKYLDELATIDSNNSHRTSNISALKEALEREKANGDGLLDVRNKKEREYDMLCGLLEQLEKSLEETRAENEHLKVQMDGMFLPPTARDSLGAAQAFKRSATNASAVSSNMRFVDGAANNGDDYDRRGGEEAGEFMDDEEGYSYFIGNENNNDHHQQQQQQKIPWRGTSFSRTITNASTFSTKEQFEKPHLHHQAAEEGNHQHQQVTTPRQLIAGGAMRVGGVHYDPPISSKKKSVEESISPRVAHMMWVSQHGLQRQEDTNATSASSIHDKKFSSSSSSASNAFSRQNTPVKTSVAATENNNTQRRRQPSTTTTTPTMRSTSAGVTYKRKPTTANGSSRASTPTNNSYSSSSYFNQSSRQQRLRDQLANSKPVFSLRGESLSGSVKVVIETDEQQHQQKQKPPVLTRFVSTTLDDDHETQSNHSAVSSNILSPQSTQMKNDQETTTEDELTSPNFSESAGPNMNHHQHQHATRNGVAVLSSLSLSQNNNKSNVVNVGGGADHRRHSVMSASSSMVSSSRPGGGGVLLRQQQGTTSPSASMPAGHHLHHQSPSMSRPRLGRPRPAFK